MENPAGPAMEISPQQASAVLDGGEDVFLLDVRSRPEYDKLHLADCVLIPFGDVENRIAANDLFPDVNYGRAAARDRKILVYCTKGVRSLIVTRRLLEMGFADVTSISGGLKAWVKAGLPVTRASKDGRQSAAAQSPAADGPLIAGGSDPRAPQR